ncbi:MAG: hydrogenase formation protein HypD [Proteobacteria bacterium]|nr:hydrogenase formation protein HypD [Pseudomonadota bacterium]
MDRRPQFKDPALAKALLTKIGMLAKDLPEVRIMEVCGTHTMEIGRLGLRQRLPDNIRLLSGPGCPVCVTPGEVIDSAVSYAQMPNHVLATFGDMIRVPGSGQSLEQVKANGAAIAIVASPLQLIKMAEERPETTIVFAAVGFETTIPAVARTIEIAAEKKLPNLKMLVAHRLLPPALSALCGDADTHISGFLLPGHVSAIIGEEVYRTIDELNVPGAITGFEALDILGGILSVLEMLINQTALIINMYPRVVRPEGNPHARALIHKFFTPIDAAWRGIGIIPQSGLALRDEFKAFDAPVLTQGSSTLPKGCSCGKVLKGLITPSGCSLFGSACTPQTPIGPCMVSSEGSCAAYYRYERINR